MHSSTGDLSLFLLRTLAAMDLSFPRVRPRPLLNSHRLTRKGLDRPLSSSLCSYFFFGAGDKSLPSLSLGPEDPIEKD